MRNTKKKRQTKVYIVFWTVVFSIFGVGVLTGVLIGSSACHTEALSVETENYTQTTQSTATEPPAVSEAITTEPEYIAFTATAYCGCSKCCGKWANNRPDGKVIGAAGVELKQGVSIAADFSVLPIGTSVDIEGLGTYKVQDTGAAVTGNKIDIYFLNHDDAVEFGVQTVYLRVLEK
jgi:3D (Asp-Asp-Asp) domain-containing protein